MNTKAYIKLTKYAFDLNALEILLPKDPRPAWLPPGAPWTTDSSARLYRKKRALEHVMADSLSFIEFRMWVFIIDDHWQSLRNRG